MVVGFEASHGHSPRESFPVFVHVYQVFDSLGVRTFAEGAS